MTFGEDALHLGLVVSVGQFPFSPAETLEPSDVGHGLISSIGKPTWHEIGPDLANSVLFPNSEVVGQLTVHHVVVVGRVDTHQNL